MKEIQDLAYLLDMQNMSHSVIIKEIEAQLGYITNLTADDIEALVKANDILASVDAMNPKRQERMSLAEAASKSLS